MAINWIKTYKKYRGLWVALLDDQKTVVGSGKTIKTALEQATRKGHKNPIMMRVPTIVIPYVGSFRL